MLECIQILMAENMHIRTGCLNPTQVVFNKSDFCSSGELCVVGVVVVAVLRPGLDLVLNFLVLVVVLVLVVILFLIVVVLIFFPLSIITVTRD